MMNADLLRFGNVHEWFRKGSLKGSNYEREFCDPLFKRPSQGVRLQAQSGVRRAAPFVPSRSETITQNKGLGLDDSIAVQRNVKLDTSSPVDRMLAQKLVVLSSIKY